MKRDKMVLGMILAIFGVVAVVAILGVVTELFLGGDDESLQEQEIVSVQSIEELYEGLKVNVATDVEKVKGVVNLSDSTLYDELPEIDKYPLSVQGRGDIDIEIFTSGEKAGNGTDAWLIDCATAFNKLGVSTGSGESVSISVRSVASGLGADYIVSNKYLPDLYTPSNTLFADYAMLNGARMTLYNERLVGNTAGILVRKGSGISSVDAVVDLVTSGVFNLGYTNPQSSASGVNLLVWLLKSYGNGVVDSEQAAEAFSKFNSNIPFVAYTTQQMRDSASNGTLDGMVSEYQAYINDKNLTSLYDFIPFGMRHDNPLYLVDGGNKTEDELEAISLVSDYLMGSTAQKLASDYGFNANNDYVSDMTVSGAEVSTALRVYKEKKDAGKDIIAVFVADCSGSMSGEAINQLKESLSNGAQYINSNNYIGLVSYGSNVSVDLPIAKFDFNQQAYFQGAVSRLDANGGTSTYEALVVALSMIQQEQAQHPNSKAMVLLLTDGYANGSLKLKDIEYAVRDTGIPIYTIGYTRNADTAALAQLSSINEATSVDADSDDIVYKIKALFNAQM